MNFNGFRPAVLCVLGISLILPFRAASEGVERSTSLSIEGAYYLDDNKGYGVSDGGFASISYSPVEVPGGFSAIPPDDGRSLGSGWGGAEIQVVLKHRISLPFLTGSGALTAGNNIALAVAAALTPVSARLELGATLTPIAFLNLFAGAMVGSGWDLGLFNGMGLNADGSGTPESASLQGLVVKPWVGATFQFDLAALVPGEWTHLVTLVSPKLEYAWFSGAGKGEAWMWEADEGENFNGFKLYGSFFLGYQMPLVLDLVGILLETEQNLGYVKDLSTMSSGGWGSDYLQITVGPVLDFRLSERSSLAVLVQFRRERLYSDTGTPASIFYNYYENRSYQGAYWDFYRIAFSHSLNF